MPAFTLALLGMATTVGAKLAVVRQVAPSSFEGVSSAGMLSATGFALVAREIFVALVLGPLALWIGHLALPNLIDVGGFWERLAFAVVAVTFSQSFEALLGAGFRMIIAFSRIPAPLALFVARFAIVVAVLLLAVALVPNAVLATEAIVLVGLVHAGTRLFENLRAAGRESESGGPGADGGGGS